jgi:hypothetical protein
VTKLKIQERPPSTLRNVDGGPPGGAGAEDLRAPIINTKKRRWQALGRLVQGHVLSGPLMAGPREVPELKIRECPPSTLRNIDGGPPRGVGAEDPGAPTINAKKRRQRAPGRCRS